MNSGSWVTNPVGYSTVESLLEDVARQMASSNLSRSSRGPSGQKTGGSMRIVKPNSSSNSPRSSIGLGRRRTVMGEGPSRQRMMMMVDQSTMPHGDYVSNDGLQIPVRSNRPMSWHPASHTRHHASYNQACHSMYPASTASVNSQYHLFDCPPPTDIYSGFTSPASTFSPASIPFNGYAQQYAFQEVAYQTSPVYPTTQIETNDQQIESLFEPVATNMDPTMYSHFDWRSFATDSLDQSSTSPPTPENFLPIQHPDPTFPSEDSIPYHALSENEDSGEELIGMGLYDNPEAVKPPSSDPQLDNYRALMMSQLMGPTYRRPESEGKGLKLEETWNPPASDDEEEADDEQDGEGEYDEEPVISNTQAAHTQVHLPQSRTDPTPLVSDIQGTLSQPDFGHQTYNGNGWL